jgi:hypothetical protein
VKTRLARLENRRKLDDSKDAAPGLRRTSQPADTGDDQPELKRKQ